MLVQFLDGHGSFLWKILWKSGRINNPGYLNINKLKLINWNFQIENDGFN